MVKTPNTVPAKATDKEGGKICEGSLQDKAGKKLVKLWKWKCTSAKNESRLKQMQYKPLQAAVITSDFN